MTLRQTVNPNYGIGATRGWCLQYVDDAISAPNRVLPAHAGVILLANIADKIKWRITRTCGGDPGKGIKPTLTL